LFVCELVVRWILLLVNCVFEEDRDDVDEEKIFGLYTDGGPSLSKNFGCLL
jgi:hypothetical protein